MTVDDQNPVYLFTFSYVDAENDNAVLDNSIKVDSYVYGNVMNKRYDYTDLDEGTGCVIILNDNVFAGDGCNSNTFGEGCYSNTFGDYCNTITFGENCSSNTFGNNCSFNTFGEGCYSNTFGGGCCFIIFGNSCQVNTFGEDCQYIDISTQYTKYYRVLNGLMGTFQSHLALTTTASNNYETYVGNNSSGVLKYYCPMDSAS